MPSDFADPAIEAGIAGIASGFERRTLDPHDVLTAYLDRIARYDGSIGAFVSIDESGARRAAKASAERHTSKRALGPLDGVPIGIKANIAVAGLPWTAGVGDWRDRIAVADAACVARLRALGAVIVGTLNMDEAALGAATDNPSFGRTENPHRAGASAGGSSGGPAAAVAAGLCAAALGTDTMGSVRIPAAYCGVAALLPRAGRIARDGVVPLAPSFDRVGLFARSTADLGPMLAAFDQVPSPDRRVVESSRIAALALEHLELAPAVRAAHAAALERLVDAGLTIDTISLDAYVPATAARALLVAVEAEGFAVYGEWLASGAISLSRPVRDLLDWGGRLTATRRLAVCAELRAIDTAVRAALGPYSALLLPATPQPAFDFADGPPANVAWFTSLASITGLPAAVVPIGLDEAGRPLAIQIVSWSDASALALAAVIEKACVRVLAPPRFAGASPVLIQNPKRTAATPT